MSRPIDRRTFLKGMLASGGLLWLGFQGVLFSQWQRTPRSYPGRLLGPSYKRGHQLRDAQHTVLPSKTLETDVVIVGGGIAGLSAGWWLQKHGFDRFTILELEDKPGGNSRSDENAVSPYPWGAHYVPLPNREAVLVRELFEELDVITGYDAKGLPVYNDLYLCHDPEERLYKDGQWQEGLVPSRGLRPQERQDLSAFFNKMEQYRNAVGSDGKPAFAIPAALSSRDLSYTDLDGMSMAQWLKQEGFTSPAIQWYVTYCCRDDYGATPDQVSAWAGIHYFAGRRGDAANAESNTVLTWPEGNGWLVKRLSERLNDSIQTGAMATSVVSEADGVRVRYLNARNEMVEIKAQQVIMAAPRFVARHLIPELRQDPPDYLKQLSYSPWMVANVTLKRPPQSRGFQLAWDNVSYYSQSLGYVVTTHQAIRVLPQKTVLTTYWPLTDVPPSTARKDAITKTHGDWTALIAEDLKRLHPGIEHDIENIDVWVWGHGMIRPTPGFIWGPLREAMQKPLEHIIFAHSDMSGLSLFEEAQYHGVEAAKTVLRHLQG